MFTLEESALLSRMLRVVAWLVVGAVISVGGYILFRWETRSAVASHPTATLQGHHHS